MKKSKEQEEIDDIKTVIKDFFNCFHLSSWGSTITIKEFLINNGCTKSAEILEKWGCEPNEKDTITNPNNSNPD